LSSRLPLALFKIVAKVFKWLCLFLLVYVDVLFVSNVDWADVMHEWLGVQLQFTHGYLGLVVAVLGTTISPYMFIWQSAQRIEELREETLDGNRPQPLGHRTGFAAKRTLLNVRIDVFMGMIFSVLIMFLIMFAIMAATASTLGAHGQVVTDAAGAPQALEPIAGAASEYLFAAGFVCSGVLAVPVLAASGAAGMAGLLNKPWGFERSPTKAPVFSGLLGVGIVLGTILSVVSFDPIGLLIFSAIVNGVAVGPFLIVMMLISRDRKIMGKYRNGKIAATLGWTATGIMCLAGAYGIWFTLFGR
jgi:Mn2+/Fe2+ NRAMP family transporter